MNEEEYIIFLKKKFDLGTVQAWAIFTSVKYYLQNNPTVQQEGNA